MGSKQQNISFSLVCRAVQVAVVIAIEKSEFVTNEETEAEL